MVESARGGRSGALADWLDRGDGRPAPWRTFVVALAGYLFFAVTYLAINEFSVGRPSATLYLPGEESIPLVPEFEFLYVLGYVLPVYAVFRIPTAHRLVRFVWAFGITLLVAYVVYLVYPVYLERPPLKVDSLASLMLSLEYLDHSYNHLPSLHVALVWLAYLAARPGLKFRIPYVILAMGMSIAPVFIKQHYALDLVAGALLALVAWRVSRRIWPAGVGATGERGVS